MPAPVEITGQKFGRLTAIALDVSSGSRRWLFRCDCGNETTVPSAGVIFGNTRSCGCLRKETTSAARSINLTGKTFGRLTVLAQIRKRDKHGLIYWSCLCQCGEKTTGSTAVLNRGSKQSCGCIRREKMRALGTSSKKENPVSRTPEYRSSFRKRRREKPVNAMAERVSRLMAWALASVGAIKRSATFVMLGYTPAQLKAHIEKQFTPGMSWANRAEWEVDHITPISTATCEVDIIALNQLSNLRPLWALDNNRKGTRLDSLI